ncbi:hypothetical protein [Komagataeibacter diospyri]|uniref:hypothetical protein n=1 Tax=Komagataeibacter diospyri TaxID=1932662 RepID=UPI0037579A84
MNTSKRGIYRNLINGSLYLAVLMTCSFVGSFQASAADLTTGQNTKIARALAAGPPGIAAGAAVAEPDGSGHLRVLREGTNAFTCMPGDPMTVGKPAMCMNKAAMQWGMDFDQHKPRPTNTEPGIIYMLSGATQRSDMDPYDTHSPPITVGPHWMIMWPFDAATSGLPTHHKSTGAYIMWPGSPYAHVHIMGVP